MPRGRPARSLSINAAVGEIPLLLEYWNRAKASPYGIKIIPRKGWTCKTMAVRLYEARKECGHDAYDGFKCVETDTHVWIIPK